MTDQNPQILVTIAIIGGTGKEGTGLAKRWATSGYRVIIGSRDAERAQQKVDELNAEMGGTYLHGMENLKAAKEANLIVITVPYAAHKDTVQSLKEFAQGKIVVDVTVPIQPPNVRTVYVPEGKSACLESQAILGPGAKVCAAFQNVSSVHLRESTEHVECDVLICGDDEAAKVEVIRLAQAAGMRGLDAGPLANSVAVEAMTPVLLWFNRRYKSKGTGVVITGIDQA